MLFSALLQKIVKRGSLTVVSANGRRRDFGDGSGPPVTIRLHDATVPYELALNPYLKLGEAYMDGRLTIEPPATIYELLDLLTGNLGNQFAGPFFEVYGALRRMKRRLDQHNPVGKAEKNVAHHYDLDGGIYDLFLDKDKQYSCAYFREPEMTLEEAQLAKKRHIAAKLRIEPGMRVLDIGCGWGGMALTLAEETGAEVTGVTLSREQLKVAQRRAEERGLAEKVEFRLQDYRTIKENFDRVVSVGMFEHVGVGHYGEYFGGVQHLLAPDGVALIHTIGRLDPPGSTNPWIAKYIFPGGYIPALSEMAGAVERSGLLMTDIEVLRLHYAQTLREWRKRFMERRETAARIYDERFCRMWEFYLAGSETSFRNEGMVVFQMQIAKSLQSLPLSRDYMVDEERRLNAGAEQPQQRLLAGD
ncbi:cyclopropane-fatty-acyl-phospholipid synthase family protein [Parvibaculum sp.]|jgi:cyclopropane-fatty-acyl-phospholipid synthase|uniref:cyclopropane-fatty-acyl-phospholipid synthase family protein n=1 Tax=Parvibaculum sp. TaxID=2024848 RepID=UPI001B2BB1E5|nr:cyclopropane-fatty-acyl-phospholipid synthase family protein [Parvibaculum sp.]MBO6678902.1 class I SAM-dependent methyltransferase [Parvibaculum sp.]MBO6685512.1 class I SAM-dependent methyltransferase [Parvibaculum sp.]MBO6903408.1 class I SAM-dependent methyltransferase [Parvibaculum sp.]